MPNWAYGDIAIRGHKKEDIQNFVLRFLFTCRDEMLVQAGLESDYQYFARTFIDCKDAHDVIRLFNQIEDGYSEDTGRYRLSLLAEFAWSASTCVIRGEHGYIKDENGNPKPKLISLDEAAKAHNVWVEIFTEELGNCFEEHMLVNNQGEWVINDHHSVLVDEDEEGCTVISGGYDEGEGYPFEI